MTQDIRPEYEGWRNYETWAVGLWLANDEGLYDGAREVAARGSKYLMESAMHDYVESILFGDEAPATLGTDLLTHALAYVDWPAIVERFQEE